jgi:uncharacterized protein (AIM24 family)
VTRSNVNPVPDRAFVARLTRGGELLRAEKLDAAVAELREALALRPGEAKVLNLLGLATFRLGRFLEAREIFKDLSGRRPDDASMRLNLGLVHLKMGEVDEAIRELRRARDLDPAQVRTLGYLGLAYARQGEFALARDAFRAAGQEDLAREMEEQLEAPSEADAVPKPVADITTARVSEAPDLRASPPLASSAPGHTAPLPLPVFAATRLLRPQTGDLPIELGPGNTLVVRVRGKMLARPDGILLRSGDLHWEPAGRRSRGRVTEERFGSLHVVAGTGHFVVASGGGIFTALLLSGDVLYLRETAVVAFEERLGWENGRVPGNPGEIAVVQFRGDGCVATLTAHPPLIIELGEGHPVSIDPAALIGWTGGVVPRLVEELVECTGEGMVLVEEPARAAGP